jgi:hypothetical protein
MGTNALELNLHGFGFPEMEGKIAREIHNLGIKNCFSVSGM